MINKKSNIFRQYCHSISISLIFDFKLQAQVTSSKAQTRQMTHWNSVPLVEAQLIRLPNIRKSSSNTSFMRASNCISKWQMSIVVFLLILSMWSKISFKFVDEDIKDWICWWRSKLPGCWRMSRLASFFTLSDRIVSTSTTENYTMKWTITKSNQCCCMNRKEGSPHKAQKPRETPLLILKLAIKAPNDYLQ